MIKYHGYIAAFMLLLLTARVGAQEGGVIVHSDPRLALLVKKHDMAPMASNLPLHKTTHSKTALASADNLPSPTSRTVTTAAASTAVAGKIAANIPANAGYVTAPVKPDPVKINNDEASTTGHTGGWSPPVRRKAKSVYSGKGFRVQIYNGPDRQKAIQVKTEFMRNYPNTRTYISYVAPCFRVKVGDYRTRNEALGMLKEANSVYSPCMIVPDIVIISTF